MFLRKIRDNVSELLGLLKGKKYLTSSNANDYCLIFLSSSVK